MPTLNLDQLASFAQVIQLGSFSQAARKLGVSQPAVSMQVRSLESRLGLRLIERIGKRAMPTAAGRDLLAYAHRLDNEARAAIRHLEAYKHNRLGRVRIGTGATASIYLLPGVLQALRAGNPNLEITVLTGNSADMVEAVEENILDIAFVTLPVIKRGLEVREILFDSLVAVLPSSEVIHCRSVRPEFFRERQLILYEPQGAMRALIDAWFAASGTRIQPAMELGNVEATKRLVAAGFGCSILPSLAVQGENREPRISLRPLAPTLGRSLGLVLRQDKVIDHALRATIRSFESLVSGTVGQRQSRRP